MSKPLILVVEDDPSVRNLITTTLKTNDYRYVVAPNGSTAIMETTSHNPEIILPEAKITIKSRRWMPELTII